MIRSTIHTQQGHVLDVEDGAEARSVHVTITHDDGTRVRVWLDEDDAFLLALAIQHRIDA